MLHRHTSSAGWVASAGGAIAAQVVPTAAQWSAMLDVLVRLLLAGAGIAVGRLVWEVADRVWWMFAIMAWSDAGILG